LQAAADDEHLWWSRKRSSRNAPERRNKLTGMDSAAVRRLKELIAANDSPSSSSMLHANSSKFSLPSPSPYVQRFQPLLATPNVTAPLSSSRRQSPQLPNPLPHSNESAQAAISGKGSLLNDFETTLLMLRMQRMELEAESRVRLLDPSSPTRHHPSSSQRSVHSHENSPLIAQDMQQQQQQPSGAFVHEFIRLESCAVRAELAARRIEESTQQCRVILQQVRSCRTFLPHTLSN
jgi:hypothetical protein